MSRDPLEPDVLRAPRLKEVVGYLNFSSGNPDTKFQAHLNELYAYIAQQRRDAKQDEQESIATALCDYITTAAELMHQQGGAFGEIDQVRAVVGLVRHHFLDEYRQFHRDLMWHRSDEELWWPLMLARVFEVILAQGGPWEEGELERILPAARDQLDDYIGYRPVAILESQKHEPYRHEWVRPLPLYIASAGVGHGRYQAIISRTLEILRSTPSNLLSDAWFQPELLDELALDPRAYDFDHPVNKRPNYHFGQWDPHCIDNKGYYRRFVLQPLVLDALLTRVAQASTLQRDEEQLLLEAAVVLAGTMLMASGTSGNGPNCHGSDVTLSTLLPHIADYRDRFYEQILARVEGAHGEWLRKEAAQRHQPFGGARQHLNQEITRCRAVQLQRVHLAQIYARMGYPQASQSQAQAVRVASARMLCQIYCRLTAAHRAIDRHRLSEVSRYLEEIDNLLQRGIECGALVDPWNILGFGGQFSLFPALENSVRDYRVHDLIQIVEQTLDLCSRAWAEAAAVDDAKFETEFATRLAELADWWDNFGTAQVSGIQSLVAKEIEISTNLVAGALNAWHKAGAAAGDVAFWGMFVDQFDTPKAFQLVIEALLEKDDLVASMALIMQWVSQADYTLLEEGDASFHSLILRWLRLVQARAVTGGPTGDHQWPLVQRFFAHLEASAEELWHVPRFELGRSRRQYDAPLEELDEEGDEFGAESEDDLDNLFQAAYEDVVYQDSTDDGLDSAIYDPDQFDTDYELEDEAERLQQRLAFLSTVARLWKQTATTWGAGTEQERQERCEQFDQWQREAVSRYQQLVQLLEQVHQHRVPPPTGSHESMVEYDRRRMIQDSLIEQIITTCVEISDAGRLMRAAADSSSTTAESAPASAIARTIEILRAVLSGNAEGVQQHWSAFAESLVEQELLYVPLSRGGSPRRIVKARALHQLIHDLLGWLPRLGLVRETCELLDIAQRMELEHPVGWGAITEYDHLFENGYQALVHCVVTSADSWGQDSESPAASEANGRDSQDPAAEDQPADEEQKTEQEESTQDEQDEIAEASPPSVAERSSDDLLIEALKSLTEGQLARWLRHNQTVRLSVVERLADEKDWQKFVQFVKRYGRDLFTQRFLNLGNLRAILHQGPKVWLAQLEAHPNNDQLRLVEELDGHIRREEAAELLSIAIEAVVENYREYRDYNTTTTLSDHGEMLYCFLDFLRLRAAYDRFAWKTKPVFLAHQILVRQQRTRAAQMWRDAIAERTRETAEYFLMHYQRLAQQYGMQLSTIAERLSERFTRPLTVDCLRSLAGPAIEAAEQEDESSEAFVALEDQIASLVSEPSGAGLDVPDWIAALEQEVTQIRRRSRHQIDESMDQRIEQVSIEWDKLQRDLEEGRPS